MRERPIQSSAGSLWASMALLVVLAGAIISCSYILPATWRAFRVDPDDAPPAITRALDARSLVVADWNQENHRIVTTWITVNTGVLVLRERYIVTWERDDSEGTLTVYVRHEAQDQDQEEGRPKWSAVYHDSDKETLLLEGISKELVAMNEGGGDLDTDSDPGATGNE